MPNQPTAKTSKLKRRPRGESYWLLQVAACGNHCCAPDCAIPGPLQQGHIELHGDGFGDEPENLIPLCAKHNHKYQKVRTPDGRPEGWRERLIQLLGFALQPKLMVLHQNSWCNTIPVPEGTENKDIIKWPQPEFTLTTGVFTPSGAARKQAITMVETIKRESHELESAPYLPKAPRNKQLVILAEAYPETFLRSSREFLLRKHFMRDDGVIREDSWGPLCDNFQTYKRWAEERAARIVANAKAQRELDRVEKEKMVVRQQESLMADYLLAATTPDWPGMPDADREFKESVAVVGEELGEESLGVLRRFKLHHRDELVAAKQKLRNKLAQCAAWAKRYNADDQRRHAETIKALSDWIDRTSSIESLRHDEYSIEYLYNDLDPSRPAFDPETPF
jgi:hypothetical protein